MSFHRKWLRTVSLYALHVPITNGHHSQVRASVSLPWQKYRPLAWIAVSCNRRRGETRLISCEYAACRRGGHKRFGRISVTSRSGSAA